jgi:DNA-binding response OmpR family regulator
MKVLVVEDDLDELDVTAYALRRDGFTVSVATNGQQALERWESEDPDIVLLDVRLPTLDGFEVCRRIRTHSETPVIMLTGRGEDEDVIRGLGLGADDYVIKPFSMKQLMSRIRAVLRRSKAGRYGGAASEVRVGDLLLDFESHAVTKGGRPVELTPLEFRILYMLAINQGRVVPHARLLQYAWGYDIGDASLLKSHISRIRHKLNLPDHPSCGITAVLNVGYRLAYP